MVVKVADVSAIGVQQELDKITRSPAFASSPILRRFLSHIVDKTLNGRPEELKEYTLAVEVFGRPVSFDPRLDPIVRVQASNLRSKLKAYYSDLGREDSILIDIPRGRYVCQFIPQPSNRVIPSIHRPGRPGSVAVLVCADLSRAQDQETFCDGVTEEIIHVLSSVPEIRVVGRTSVFRFKGRHIDARDIGERLGVQCVLETSCRTEGKRIRLAAHLIEVSSGFTRWSRIFTLQRQQIFTVQEEIARSIAMALCGQVGLNSARRPILWPSGDIDTYNLYLLAKHYLNKRNEENIRKSLSILEPLQNREPGNAQVLLSLADCHLVLAFAGAEAPKSAMAKTEQFASQALTTGYGHAEAHAYLGSVKALYRWDWIGAEREFDLALQFDADNVSARISHAAFCLLPRGRVDEAVAQMRDSLKLDPLSIAANQMLVWALVACRRYDEAIQKCTLLVEMEPSFARAHTLLGMAYTLAGLHREGRQRLAKSLRLSDSQSFLPNLAVAVCVYSIAGAKRQAVRAWQVLEHKAEKGVTSCYWQAVAQAHLGNEKAAMRLLKDAVSMKDPWVTAAGYDPLAEPLRKHPRFSAVVRDIGLARFE